MIQAARTKIRSIGGALISVLLCVISASSAVRNLWEFTHRGAAENAEVAQRSLNQGTTVRFESRFTRCQSTNF